MSVKKKVFWIVTLIIAAAVLIVLCISLITVNHTPEYDGTLVRLNKDFPVYF